MGCDEFMKPTHFLGDEFCKFIIVCVDRIDVECVEIEQATAEATVAPFSGYDVPQAARQSITMRASPAR